MEGRCGWRGDSPLDPKRPQCGQVQAAGDGTASTGLLAERLGLTAELAG